MVDDNGALSADDKQKFLNWLNQKGRINPACPVCGSNNWTVGDHLVQNTTYNPAAGLVVGGPSYPAALLVCNTCAFTRHFMAVPIGLLPPNKTGGK